MRLFTLCLILCPCLVLAGSNCELKTKWEGNACSLGGGLQVKSAPGNRVLTVSENCNSFIQKAEFQNQPSVSLPEAKEGEMYSVVMVDPDAPNHPEGTFWLHWIAANIPGEDLKKGDLTKAKTITSYKGPTPPNGTGTHRYMILVYRHEKAAPALTQEVPDNHRGRFSLAEWLKKQPVGLCGPISAVQFRTNFSGKQ